MVAAMHAAHRSSEVAVRPEHFLLDAGMAKRHVSASSNGERAPARIRHGRRDDPGGGLALQRAPTVREDARCSGRGDDRPNQVAAFLEGAARWSGAPTAEGEGEGARPTEESWPLTL